MAKAVAELPDLLEIYGRHGIPQWEITDVIGAGPLPKLRDVAVVLGRVGIDAAGTVYMVFCLYVLGLLGLTIGWQTRMMAIIAWLCYLTMWRSSLLTSYGVDGFAIIGLFYCVLMPTGKAYSLDVWLRHASDEPTWETQLFLRVLQIHVCIVYLFSGYEKATGAGWWNGEAIWKAAMQPQFGVFDYAFLANNQWLLIASCSTTLLIELGYSFLIWPSKTRKIWLTLTVGLHLGIGIFMGLHLFAAMMICYNFGAFGHPFLEAIFRRRTNGAGALEGKTSP